MRLSVMSISSRSRVALAIGLAGGMVACATADPYLADFDYPEPVQRYEFRSQGQQLFMAYMDVPSPRPNGKTIVLMHGKNFCGATWEGCEAGYRVVVPDQIGFCKSSKPPGLSVWATPTWRQYPRAAFSYWCRTPNCRRAFHGRDAGDALRAPLSPRPQRAGARQSDWVGGLEGQGYSDGDGRPALRARA